MCGIVGIFGDSNLSEIEVYISNMTNALKHRGPDSKGIWLDEKRNLALGHRRLSIIDLSDTGHQPTVSNCGRLVLSFNGEIYNHLELRKKFENLSKEKNDKELIWKGTSDDQYSPRYTRRFTIWPMLYTGTLLERNRIGTQ